MSHKNIKTTTVERVFTMLKGSVPVPGNESDIVEWCGEALDAIGVVTQHQETVCFAEVRNFTAKVPRFCHSVIQIARNNHYNHQRPDSLVTPSTIEICLENIIREPMIASAYTNDSTKTVFSVDWGYTPWYRSALYKLTFTPVRLTSNVFFNSKVCREKDYEEIYKNCGDEYDIIDGDTLKFSFQQGQVAIAYNKIKMDEETGYPLIPDNISWLTAIVNYCRWQWFTRKYYNGDEGAEGKMNKAEEQWIWYCGQAKNKSLMIEGVDEHQNFLDQRSYFLPDRNKYFGNFGGLNKAENRSYNNPRS